MSNVIIDTNVPINANANVPNDLLDCSLACIDVIETVIKNKNLVLDNNGEIFEEYSNKLSFSGQPGVGDKFLKWVHDNQWGFPLENRVSITKNGTTYDEFPTHAGLVDFDISDRKFVAVSNAHPNKPSIYQATDSKWWGWKDALSEVGIEVNFLCQEYIETKYQEKMGQ